MNAIRIHQHGGAEQLEYEQAPAPEPKSGEALVRVRAAGVNFIDVYHRTGLYQQALPLIPGMEAAGVVEATGDGVSGIKVGDRVAYAMQIGAYAEYAVVPAWKLAPLPDPISFDQGAAVMLQGMTAHYLTQSVFPLRSEHTCLIHAAAGGVGLLLVQMAKRNGARVIGTVSTEQKAALARSAGADEFILYTQQDFEAEVKRITAGEGVHVVYDSVGKSTWEKSMNSLRPKGYLVFFGNASGPVPPIDPLLLSAKGSLFITRPTLATYTATRDELLGRSRELFDWIQAGQLTLRIHDKLPLAQARKAHELLESRQTSGKLLLEV